MQTLGSALDEQKGYGQGFDFMRIFLATAIIAWHTASLTGHLEMARASAFWFFEYALVPMFFVLSGFLVAGSGMRLSTKNFVLNRAARIVPALFADIVFAALLIGPLVTTLPANLYFTGPTFFTYFLNIAGWVHYSLPGVFASNPSPAVNGALWTVPYEIGCYVIFAGLMISGAIKRPRLVLLLTYLLLVIAVPLSVMTSLRVNPASSFVEWAAQELFLQRGSLLWPAFLIGIVLYQLRYHVPFSKMAAGGIVGAAILVSTTGDSTQLFDNPAVHVIALPLLAYLTVVIGLSPMPRLPGFESGDYSYGLYLYHVPFIQLLIHYFPQAWTGDRWWTLFFASFPLALTAAVVSWHLIEYPVLKLRKRFSFAINHRPGDSIPTGMISSGQFLARQNLP